MRSLLSILTFFLTLTATASAQNNPIAFLNIKDGQVVQAVMPNSPGATITHSGGVKSLKVEIFRPDGSRWWERHENGTLACITGLNDGACSAWTTNYVPDGTYTLRATAALNDGSSFQSELRFSVANTNALPLSPATPGRIGPRPQWNDVRSWMRQDTDCRLFDIINSRFGMVTISARCAGRFLEPADLERIRASGKWVLAYEDVAAAAPWDKRTWPNDVNAASPFIKFQTNWGSYLVDVTSDAWFRVLEKVIRDDLGRGYDGIWLDDCAGFQFEGDTSPQNVERYVRIVKRVRALVDSIRPGVKIICNTDATLIRDSLEGQSGFLEALDGVNIEGFTYHCFGPGECRANDATRRASEEQWATAAQQAGEKVFTLDYALTPTTQREAWEESRRRGWTPAVNQGATIGVWID